jgi:hypothetical protein
MYKLLVVLSGRFNVKISHLDVRALEPSQLTS